MTTNRLPDHKLQPTVKKNEDSQEQISNWITKHKEHYLSLSIPADRKDEVLHHGKLRPTEEVLRKDFKCSINPKFENISRLINDYKNESKTAESKPLPERFIMHNSLSFAQAYKYNLFSDADYSKLVSQLNSLPVTSALPTVTLKDGKTYQITRDMTGNSGHFTNTIFQIKGLPYLEIIYPNAPLEDLLNKWVKHYDLYTDRGAQYAFDMLAKQTIDSQLAILWETYKVLTFNTDALRSELFNKRGWVIQTSNSPYYYLEASKNTIEWTETDTIQILRGNPKQIYTHIPTSQWVPLLYPWENNGEMFSLDLSEENTIIIGPREQLEPYANKNTQPIIQALHETGLFPNVIPPLIESYSRKYKIFYFEDMTKEQLKFFKVPAHLNPYTKIATEKLMSAMKSPMEKIEKANKRRAFTQWRLFAESASKNGKEIKRAICSPKIKYGH